MVTKAQEDGTTLNWEVEDHREHKWNTSRKQEVMFGHCKWRCPNRNVRDTVGQHNLAFKAEV